ncbi:MAG: polyprenyl synthetase family protein [Anaerolineae bacterium]|nr:polyprenyl synthetase family protein [Anaerolineae bacterium]MCX8066274.1 polyprenyl synthetase family protein [Anaerolineae bacterium]MDW7992043.1 polyprenyl synthetase family protein [Anaerolineae bacterium]
MSSDFSSFLDRYLPALEAEMQEVVASAAGPLEGLYGMLRYHMGWADEQFRPAHMPAGKRLRPLFCLLVCEVCGGNWEHALPAAAAVELTHNFSLIHDDIEDGDRTRRGRPTVWALWGIPQGLNAGDALFALAHIALLRLMDRGVSPEKVVEAVRILDQACLRLTEGQYLDLLFEGMSDVTVDQYLQMIERKTGALLSAACELGALVAGAPLSIRKQMAHFGHHVGLAFQIRDDYLGIWGDPQRTGKPVGSDLRRGKKTYPVVWAMEQSAQFRALMAQPSRSEEEIAQALRFLEASGARAQTESAAMEALQTACSVLEQFPAEHPALRTLVHMTDELAFRDR